MFKLFFPAYRFEHRGKVNWIYLQMIKILIDLEATNKILKINQIFVMWSCVGPRGDVEGG